MKMFPHCIRLPVLMFIILGFCQGSESGQKPIILQNSRQIIINEGDTLNITCISTLIRFKSPDKIWQPNETELPDEFLKTVFQYNFSKEKIVLSDTGWYCCISNTLNIFPEATHFYNTEVNWFFVYVKPNKEFVVNDNTTIYLNAFNYIRAIPCHSTSTDADSLLLKDNEFEINKTSFGLRVIFTLDINKKLPYGCSEKTDNEMRLHAVNYLLYMLGTPTIVFYAKENVTSYVQKKSGDNVELSATIYEDGGKSFLQWFKPNGERIINSPKYYVRFTRYGDNKVTFALLQIIDINIMDSGNYMLQAQNDYWTAKKNFLLDIIDKPISSLTRAESYYSLNESTEFHCKIISNPPSNITWSFLRCPNYPSFENTTIVHLTNVMQRVAYNSRYKIESMVKMLIEVSGKIKCEACNTLGCDSKNETILVSDGLGALGIIGPRESVVQGDNIELICVASVYHYTDDFTWTVRVNQTEKPVIETERLKLVQHRTPFTYRSTLKLNNVQKSDAQDYFCVVEIMDMPNQETIEFLSEYATYTLIIYDAILPFFTNTNMNRSKTRNIDMITEGHYTVLQCFADGMPKPEVFTWYTPFIISVTSIPILVFILMILAIFITIKVCCEKKRRKKMIPDLMYFDGIPSEYINPNSTLKDLVQFLPYDKKWEFPRERLKLKEQLDNDNFGEVVKAKALAICENELVTTVAVKMIRQSDKPIYIRAFLSELKIMLQLGKHLNVVNLLGVCTKNVLKGELLVIMEYYHFGNLHKYLSSHRYKFINQIDSKTGKLDFTIGADILKTTINVGNDNRAGYETFQRNICKTFLKQTYATWVQTLQGLLSYQNAYDNNSCQTTNYSSNYKDQNFRPICTQDLLCWSFQVARGMEYLSQKKVVHCDVAARNILLAKDNVVKICNFGLAKVMLKDYKKIDNDSMPIKWMAIESIGHNVFTMQSDVWSFGIMLWEFFTLAKEPYPGIETEKLYQKLIEGYRMEQPDYANREIYDIMFQCWEAALTSRPSFINLVENIGKLLEESVRMHYINLNTPYMDMDEKNLNVNPGCSKDDSEISNPNPIQDHSHTEFQSPESDYEDIELSLMLKHEEDARLKPMKITSKENLSDEGKQ